MSPEGDTPGSTCDASGFQAAAEPGAAHSAVTGRTARPRQETAQAAFVRQPGQWEDFPEVRSAVLPTPSCAVRATWLCTVPSACVCVETAGAASHGAADANMGVASPVTSTRISSHAERRIRARSMCSGYSRQRGEVEFRGITGSPEPVWSAGHSFAARSRSALPMTDTELRDIARAATTGLSRMPRSG